MFEFLFELSQFGLVASIVYILYTLITVGIVIYSRLVNDAEARYKSSTASKILLWISITYIITFFI